MYSLSWKFKRSVNSTPSVGMHTLLLQVVPEPLLLPPSDHLPGGTFLSLRVNVYLLLHIGIDLDIMDPTLDWLSDRFALSHQNHTFGQILDCRR